MTADRSFSESAGASMQSGETLVQTQIVGSLRQHCYERSQSFSRNVVRDKEFGVGERGADSQRDFIGIVLVNGRSGGLQLVHDNGSFFRSDEVYTRGSPSELCYHLLVVRHVQGVLRLHGCQLLIQITGAWQVAGLDRSVRQQFVYLGDVSVVSGLKEKSQQFLQRSRVFADMTDDGVQALQRLR